MYDIMDEGFCLIDNMEYENRESLPQLPALYLYAFLCIPLHGFSYFCVRSISNNLVSTSCACLFVLNSLTPCASSISILIQDFASKPPRYGSCSVYFTSELTR